MPIIKPTRGILLNKTHRLARGLVFFPLMNEGSGKTVFDLSGHGHHINLEGMDWKSTAYGSAPELNESGDELDVSSNPILIPALSDLTFFVLIDVDSYEPANSGFFKDGATSQGSSYVFIHDSSGYPYVKFGNGVILDPSSGTIMPTGLHHHAIVIKSNSWVGYYLDGQLTHENTHTRQIFADASLYQLGWQYATAERVRGRWITMGFYHRALSASEIAELYVKPFGMLESRTGITYSFAPTVGAEVKLLSGTVDAQSIVSGDMKSEESLQGTVDAQSTVAGDVNSEETLAGSIDAQSGAAGSLELVVPPSGIPIFRRRRAG